MGRKKMSQNGTVYPEFTGGGEGGVKQTEGKVDWG